MFDQEDIDYTTVEFSEKEANQWYFCPKCKNIPQIKLQKDSQVEVSCKCYELEAFIIDEYGKLPMNELTRFQRYYMPLDKFIGEIKSKKELPLCELRNKHAATEGQIYCTDCNKW